VSIKRWEVQSIESIPIQQEPIIVAIPRKHKYADLDKIPVSALHQSPFISFDHENATYFNKLATELFTTHGVTPLIVQSATQLHTILALVAAGFRLALVPKAAGRIQFEDVVLRPLDVTPHPFAELHLAWNPNDTNPAVRSFIELVKKEWPIKDNTTTW
jgi:DNA-binding transcriptional LysR family regulator